MSNSICHAGNYLEYDKDDSGKIVHVYYGNDGGYFVEYLSGIWRHGSAQGEEVISDKNEAITIINDWLKHLIVSDERDFFEELFRGIY
jgi:hypothetical protein